MAHALLTPLPLVPRGRYGILLYEVMARQLPYTGHDSCELIMGVITGLLARPKLSVDESNGWPAALAALMNECMLEAPERRPTFEQILDALDPLQQRTHDSGKATTVGDALTSNGLPSPVRPHGNAPAEGAGPRKLTRRHSSHAGGSTSAEAVAGESDGSDDGDAPVRTTTSTPPPLHP